MNSASLRRAALVTLAALLATACGTSIPAGGAPAVAAPTVIAGPSPPPGQPLVLGVIGDYGVCHQGPSACANERAVANMVHSWHPAAILTVGDNSYDDGTCAAVRGDSSGPSDSAPYMADILAGHFYQATGNHDWHSGLEGIACATAFFGHLTHYVVHLADGLVDLFVLDMNADTDSDGAQARAYRASVAASTARGKLTSDHQAFYGSGSHGTQDYTHWAILPQIDLFLSGHDHDQEHLKVNGQNFVVDGVGGNDLGAVNCCATGSVWHQSGQPGAVRLTVTPDELLADFVAIDAANPKGRVLHEVKLSKSP